MERGSSRIIDEQLTEKGLKCITATCSLKPGDHMISADSSGGAIVITLPSMAEAAGQFYFIIAPSASTADVSVNVKETATEITTYGDMDTDGDHALFYCSGVAWLTIFNGLT